MKILLISPPLNEPPKVIPFGIAYVSQELKRNGYVTEILDIYSNGFSQDEVSAFIKRSSPDVIGIGGLIGIYPYLSWLIPEIKRIKPQVEVILGGAIASCLKARCFERFSVDYAVIGEGEETAVELLREIRGERNFYSVKGIGFKDNGTVVFTGRRPLMKSLENVPIIDYSFFPEEKILSNALGVAQVHTQRGCPGNCTFCFNCFRVSSNLVRYRPVGNVLDEIELLKDKFKIRLFNLAGECVMLSKKWITEFGNELLKRNLKVRYRVTSRVDTVDEERLRCLKKSGCCSISFGLESGSEKILRIMKKAVTLEQAKKAVRLAKKYIPIVEISIMLGYAGEDEKTLRETVSFVKGLGIRPWLFYAIPFPGTELYDMTLAQGRIKDEEEYLMGLDKISIFSPHRDLNLTDMPDSLFLEAINSAARQINRHFFYRDLVWFRLFRLDVVKRSLRYLTDNGFRKTARKIFRIIDNLKPSLD